MTKKPTIKDTNRALVRLYNHVAQSGADWSAFLAEYRVQMPLFGKVRNGDCAVEVRDADGELASLGEVPHRITYTNFIEPAWETWMEYGRTGGNWWQKRETR